MVGSRMGVKKKKMKRGAWTPLEDKVLMDYVKAHGKGKWANISRETGLKRCGRNCRQRWLNDLSHDNKRGNITADEEELIIRLYKLLGNRWSLIAGRLPGRTDNEIKNYWYSTLREKIQSKTTEKQLISEMSEEADATSKMDSSSCCDSPAVKHVELE